MDMQAEPTAKEKNGIFSKIIVALCLMVTAGLLISSLVSPGRAQSKMVRSSPSPVSQM